ncbi:P-loop containing nucleoside triphosphate hydrolase protein [Cyathus striatus]|nr:P-loop containing nucleoside triphosphate hydrolase protein [Cyathus striatus]
MSRLRYRVPSAAEISSHTEKIFGIKPCQFQIDDALAQLNGRDSITISPMGSGKTLTFWIPLLFNNNGIIIIITAAVNVTNETASDGLFKEIREGKHHVIIVSPEKIHHDNRFRKLWETKSFMSRLFNVSVDEGHCISQWGKEFRPEYALLGGLRWLLPEHVKFHLVSATLPSLILRDVMEKLWMRADQTTIITRSNDRANIHFVVEDMKYPANSWLDLERILRLRSGSRPPKFMCFANRRRETEEGVEQFRESTISKLKAGDIWGIICTDAAGMGLDIPDIELVIQWKYVGSLCTLVQRLGRGARRPGTEATGIYFVEPHYMDDHKKKVDSAPVRRKNKDVTAVVSTAEYEAEYMDAFINA